MDSFGLERSIEPRHALAQQAWKIDNTMTLRSDEVLIDVKIININLASFNEILDETGEDRALLMCIRDSYMPTLQSSKNRRTCPCEP